MCRLGLSVALALSVVGAVFWVQPASAADQVQAGVGRADITPPTG